MARFQELAFSDLYKSAMSNLTDKHYQIRYNNDYTWTLKDGFIHKTKHFMEISFIINPTFRDGQPLKKGTKTTPSRYTVIIRCFGINSVIQDYNTFVQLPLRQQIALIKQIFDTCEVKVHSDDPSFFYQGIWEDLSKLNRSIYKFPGPPGKGIWHDIHASSGGLQNEYIRVTKHIAQLSYESDTLAKFVAKLFSNPQKFVEALEGCGRQRMIEATINELVGSFGSEQLDEEDTELLLSIIRKINTNKETKAMRQVDSTLPSSEDVIKVLQERGFDNQTITAFNQIISRENPHMFKALVTLLKPGEELKGFQNEFVDRLEKTTGSGQVMSLRGVLVEMCKKHLVFQNILKDYCALEQRLTKPTKDASGNIHYGRGLYDSPNKPHYYTNKKTKMIKVADSTISPFSQMLGRLVEADTPPDSPQTQPDLNDDQTKITEALEKKFFDRLVSLFIALAKPIASSTGSRSVIGGGEFILALLTGWSKIHNNTGDLTDGRNSYEVKFGLGRFDGGHAKANVLSAQDIREIYQLALFTEIKKNQTEASKTFFEHVLSGDVIPDTAKQDDNSTGKIQTSPAGPTNQNASNSELEEDEFILEETDDDFNVSIDDSVKLKEAVGGINAPVNNAQIDKKQKDKKVQKISELMFKQATFKKLFPKIRELFEVSNEILSDKDHAPEDEIFLEFVDTETFFYNLITIYQEKRFPALKQSNMMEQLYKDWAKGALEGDKGNRMMGLLGSMDFAIYTYLNTITEDQNKNKPENFAGIVFIRVLDEQKKTKDKDGNELITPVENVGMLYVPYYEPRKIEPLSGKKIDSTKVLHNAIGQEVERGKLNIKGIDHSSQGSNFGAEIAKSQIKRESSIRSFVKELRLSRQMRTSRLS